MYRQYFNLEKNPFQISSDNTFLWLGEKHGAALELLKTGMTEKQRLLVLTGDIGTGKTTLINEIIATLDADTQFVKIVDPCLERFHLFEFIAQAFGFEDSYKNEKDFSSNFVSFLKTAGNDHKRILIIVDEAQRMAGWFLKEIVSWSALDPDRVLTIILAGQLEFLEVLRTTLGPTWKNNIDVHAFLEPLDEEETKTYINTRLALAGTDRKIFLLSAVHEAHSYSKGIPRLINISCDQALIAAFSKGMKIVDAPTFRQVISELCLPLAQPATPKEEFASKQKAPYPERQRRLSKKSAWMVAAACICLYIGYLFYTGYISSFIQTKTSHLPTPIKPWENKTEVLTLPAIPASDEPFKQNQVLTETIQPLAPKKQNSPVSEIGLGYTPAPASENRGSPHPVLPKDPMENFPATEKEKEVPPNLDQFIEEVFSFKEQPTVFSETAAETEKSTRHNQVQENPLSEPSQSFPDKEVEKTPDSSVEPEPDAIIEWLLETRKSKE